jgi:hypothetical protein
VGALLAEQVVMTAERLSLLDSRFIFRCHFFGIGIALGSCSERGKLFLQNASLFLAALCPVINKALLKEDNNGNSPIVDFPRDSQLRQGRGRSLMPLIQYQVPGESYRAKNPTLLSYRSDRGKGLTRTEQVLSRSAIPASKHLRTFPLLRWMTHYWNYALYGWDYSTTGRDPVTSD